MTGRVPTKVRAGLALLAAASLVALAPLEGAGQEIVRIGENDLCPAPGWALEEEVSFGSDPEIGLTGPAMAVYRRPEDGFALFFGGRVHFFGPEGRLEGSLGRPGEGPGEFGNVQIIRFDADGGLETYDGALLRRTAFGPSPDHAVRQTIPMPFAFGFLTLFHPDGSVVANRSHPAPGSVGLPLHLVDREGTVIRSFGKDPPGTEQGTAFPLARRTGWAGTGHDAVWSAEVRRYRVERWSLEGRLLGGFERDVPWFEPWDLDAPLSPETPPPPRPADVHEFGPTEVGVLLMVPADDPSQGMERQGDAWVPVRMDRIVAGRLEIIDPIEGCVRASFDIPGYPIRFLDDGAVVVYEEDDFTAEPAYRVLGVHMGR